MDNSELTLEEQFNFLVTLARTRMEEGADVSIVLHLHRPAFMGGLPSCTRHPFKRNDQARLCRKTHAVDSVLATLSMEERIAQLLMVPIYAKTDTLGWLKRSVGREIWVWEG